MVQDAGDSYQQMRMLIWAAAFALELSKHTGGSGQISIEIARERAVRKANAAVTQFSTARAWSKPYLNY